ncbi:uncharacterized protein [Ptychodera flava]|uniref:uncharacterized protein n=1 Tax=Ptychodera flava TaxID=63121 RepID=UPI00396A657D
MTSHINSTILSLPYLRGLRLAHPATGAMSFDIDVLIGADYYWDFVGDEIIRGNRHTAMSSAFGYLLSGPTRRGKTNDTNVLHVLTDTCMEEAAILNYWDLETIGVKDESQSDVKTTEEAAYKAYRESHPRIENDRYIARLPWKPEHAPLPTNFNVAKSRTRAMIRRLPSDLVNIYDRIIQDQKSRDFIEEVVQ